MAPLMVAIPDASRLAIVPVALSAMPTITLNADRFTRQLQCAPGFHLDIALGTNGYFIATAIIFGALGYRVG